MNKQYSCADRCNGLVKSIPILLKGISTRAHWHIWGAWQMPGTFLGPTVGPQFLLFEYPESVQIVINNFLYFFLSKERGKLCNLNLTRGVRRAGECVFICKVKVSCCLPSLSHRHKRYYEMCPLPRPSTP